MGIFDFVKKGAQAQFIARPDDKKGLLVYKWPDPTIPMKAQLTVAADECALFYKSGMFVGRVDPGQHTLETQNLPFLTQIIDSFTGGNVLKAEVWFITTREMPVQFGGQIGDLEDPKSGLAIETMVYGDFSWRVEDPMKVIALFGLRSWSTDEEFTDWFKSLFMKVMRPSISQLMIKQSVPLLNVTSGAMTDDIEKAVMDRVQVQVSDYGLKIIRMGNFVVSIKPDDDLTLKGLYKDAAQIRLAGGLQGFQQLAAGKAMMGAGEGMAKGGGSEGGGGNPMLAGAGMGIGMGMAGMFQQQQQGFAQQGQQQPSAPQGGVGQVTCPKCNAKVNPGKFCAECGATLAEKKNFCAACGKPMAAGAKFCAECGAQTPPSGP